MNWDRLGPRVPSDLRMPKLMTNWADRPQLTLLRRNELVHQHTHHIETALLRRKTGHRDLAMEKHGIIGIDRTCSFCATNYSDVQFFSMPNMKRLELR